MTCTRFYSHFILTDDKLTLYHYTSSEGAFKIYESNIIWSSEPDDRSHFLDNVVLLSDIAPTEKPKKVIALTIWPTEWKKKLSEGFVDVAIQVNVDPSLVKRHSSRNVYIVYGDLHVPPKLRKFVKVPDIEEGSMVAKLMSDKAMSNEYYKGQFHAKPWTEAPRSRMVSNGK